MSADCLFCRIVRGEIPAQVVARSETCLAFRDVHPQAPVHLLVIPVAHVATLNDVTDPPLIGAMARMAAEIMATEGVAERGYRTVINVNADGGQTVFHLHMHVLAGRAMKWPPG